MKITITKTSKKADPKTAVVEVKDSTTVEELKALIAKECEAARSVLFNGCRTKTASHQCKNVLVPVSQRRRAWVRSNCAILADLPLSRFALVRLRRAPSRSQGHPQLAGPQIQHLHRGRQGRRVLCAHQQASGDHW
jgi:hypothetical protein